MKNMKEPKDIPHHGVSLSKNLMFNDLPKRISQVGWMLDFFSYSLVIKSTKSFRQNLSLGHHHNLY